MVKIKQNQDSTGQMCGSFLKFSFHLFSPEDETFQKRPFLNVHFATVYRVFLIVLCTPEFTFLNMIVGLPAATSQFLRARILSVSNVRIREIYSGYFRRYTSSSSLEFYDDHSLIIVHFLEYSSIAEQEKYCNSNRLALLQGER